MPLALLFRKTFGTGQYVHDLPVSTHLGQGRQRHLGMPKHQGNLDFMITDSTVSAQYDDGGKLAAS